MSLDLMSFLLLKYKICHKILVFTEINTSLLLERDYFLSEFCESTQCCSQLFSRKFGD